MRPWQRTLLAVVGLASMVALLAPARGGGARAGVNGAGVPRTAVVAKRDFVRSLRLYGVLEAARSALVTAPRLSGQGGGGALLVTKLVVGGSTVKAGDLLVQFDAQTQVRNHIEREAEYLGLVEDLKKKRADQEAAAGQAAAELARAERDVERARLEVRKNEILSRIDAEKNTQALEEATVRLQELRRKAGLRQASARADLRALEIRAERAKRGMEHARRNKERLEIRSAIDGVVVLAPIWRNSGPGEVQEGDEVRPGSAFVQVVDPRTMQVRLKVNQSDLHLLRVGQPARILLDAYPEVELGGKVAQLGAVGSSVFSDRVRTFAGIVSIDQQERRMMPDLSAAVDVELERVPSVLVLPRDAVRELGEGRAEVRLQDGGTASVKVGARSEHEVVVLSGIDAGATVRRGGDGE